MRRHARPFSDPGGDGVSGSTHEGEVRSRSVDTRRPEGLDAHGHRRMEYPDSGSDRNVTFKLMIHTDTPQRAIGRPTKLTPTVQAAIAESIAAGAYPEQAARAAGIGRSTYYEWLQRGQAGEQPFSDFLDTLRAREAHAEVVAVTVLRDAAAAGDWRAAAHLLERRFPERWGRRAPLAVVVPPPEPERPRRDLRRLDDDELHELERIMAKVEGRPYEPPEPAPRRWITRGGNGTAAS
jgi:transposase